MRDGAVSSDFGFDCGLLLGSVVWCWTGLVGLALVDLVLGFRDGSSSAVGTGACFGFLVSQSLAHEGVDCC